MENEHLNRIAFLDSETNTHTFPIPKPPRQIRRGKAIFDTSDFNEFDIPVSELNDALYEHINNMIDQRFNSINRNVDPSPSDSDSDSEINRDNIDNIDNISSNADATIGSRSSSLFSSESGDFVALPVDIAKITHSFQLSPKVNSKEIPMAALKYSRFFPEMLQTIRPHFVRTLTPCDLRWNPTILCRERLLNMIILIRSSMLKPRNNFLNLLVIMKSFAVSL